MYLIKLSIGLSSVLKMIIICSKYVFHQFYIRSGSDHFSGLDLFCFRFTRIYLPHLPLTNLKEREKYENFFPVNVSVRTRKNPENPENPGETGFSICEHTKGFS